MPVLDSKLDTRSETYKQNRSDMLDMLGTIDELLEEVAQGGGEEAIKRLRSRDKMPIRERIGLVLDRDTPFLEISPLAAQEITHFRAALGVAPSEIVDPLLHLICP